MSTRSWPRSRSRFTLPAALAAVLTGAAVCATPAAAQDAPDKDVSLTVYSHADPASFDPQQFIAQQRYGYNPMYVYQVPGFGVVKEVRRVTLPEGVGELAMTDVAQFIDPTTVSFEDLMDAEGTTVLEQQFLFDLVSPAKLLERYVDKEIGYESVFNEKAVSVRGTVLSVNQGQVVLRTSEGLRFINAMDKGIRLPALPEGLITKPTLAWRLAAEKGGERRIRTTYQTGGITWRSDFNLVLNATDTKGDLGAWVTLMNLSGAGYPNARLKLIAGDVQRVQQQPGYPMSTAAESRKRGSRVAGFEEKSFFEYHLYTLPRRTDVAANTTQQIALFPTARDVNVEKVLVYYGLPQAANWRFSPSPHVDRNMGNQSNPKVDVYVKFENRERNHLGMPLPKGKVRVYKQDDADGTLEFVGEDLIDHTPRDETVMIKLGQAFDVVGERTQTDFKIERLKLIEETYRIQLRNHKDEAVKVIIRENLFRWSNWEILEKSDEYEKVDSRTIHFPVTVPARGEKTVTYRVRYTW